MPPSWIASAFSSMSSLTSTMTLPLSGSTMLLERDAADDAVAQRLDDFARLDDRPRLDAVHRAAIDLVDDDVLRHVDETTRQVARVRSLQRRVGRPLRAPCVEMNRSTQPSRKLAVIGVSMISPDGLAIRPRMPASWRICCFEPRAPESAMM